MALLVDGIAVATGSLVGERAAEEAGLFSGAAAQAVSIIAVITLAENENNFLFMFFTPCVNDFSVR